MTTRTPTEPDRDAAIGGVLLGGLLPVFVAAALVPFRDHLAGANEALVFVVVVVLAAAAGGRPWGAVAAVVSAVSYDFFLTRPYQSLKIDRADDIETAVLLVVIGLIVTEVVTYARRSRRASAMTREEIDRLHRVAELVAAGAPVTQVLDAACRELTTLLSLETARFEPSPFVDELPWVARNGAVAGAHRRFVGRDFALPTGGAAIEVLGRGQRFGRFVLVPDGTAGASLESRGVAVAIVDQVGAAFAADLNAGTGTERSPV